MTWPPPHHQLEPPHLTLAPVWAIDRQRRPDVSSPETPLDRNLHADFITLHFFFLTNWLFIEKKKNWNEIKRTCQTSKQLAYTLQFSICWYFPTQKKALSRFVNLQTIMSTVNVSIFFLFPITFNLVWVLLYRRGQIEGECCEFFDMSLPWIFWLAAAQMWLQRERLRVVKVSPGANLLIPVQMEMLVSRFHPLEGDTVQRISRAEGNNSLPCVSVSACFTLWVSIDQRGDMSL